MRRDRMVLRSVRKESDSLGRNRDYGGNTTLAPNSRPDYTFTFRRDAFGS